MGSNLTRKLVEKGQPGMAFLPCLALQLALLASKISERVRTFHGLGFYCKNSKSICTHHTMKMEASGDFYFIFIWHGREHFNSNIPPVSWWLSYLILGHRLELRGQGVVVGLVEQSPPLLQTLTHQLGLQFLIALLIAWKYQKWLQGSGSSIRYLDENNEADV